MESELKRARNPDLKLRMGLFGLLAAFCVVLWLAIGSGLWGGSKPDQPEAAPEDALITTSAFAPDTESPVQVEELSSTERTELASPLPAKVLGSRLRVQFIRLNGG